MERLYDKNIHSLDLSNNAFGPAGLSSIIDFLRTSRFLKVLSVTNCGVGPEGGKMIAEAMLQNQNMKLTEFYACRDRLEQKGMAALAEVFSKQ